MQTMDGRSGHLKLKDLVIEASQALARLDTARLEELALSCQALNRDLSERDLARMDGNARQELVLGAREAVGDMAVFARVLEITRDNLNVMNRLREFRVGWSKYRAEQLEYGGPQVQEWRRTGGGTWGQLAPRSVL